MENALIVAHTKKSITFFTEVLSADDCKEIVSSPSCADARLQLSQRDFDLIIINAPLVDESGESLSSHITSSGVSQVILIVQSERFDEICAEKEQEGVLVIARPMNKSVFVTALKLAKSAQNRLKRIQAESSKLKQKIEDIRVVDRAKCILISNLNISEQQAHRLIEKQAMDMRTTRRLIAEEVLRTYEY